MRNRGQTENKRTFLSFRSAMSRGGRGRRNREEARKAGGSGRKEGTLTKPIHPQPLPRRDIDTYRLTVPTYNSMTMDPLRPKKRKRKEGERWKEREREREDEAERSTSDAGNERKSGNDESIVPVQRLFCEPSRRSVYRLQLRYVYRNRSHLHLSDSASSRYLFRQNNDEIRPLMDINRAIAKNSKERFSTSCIFERKFIRILSIIHFGNISVDYKNQLID